MSGPGRRDHRRHARGRQGRRRTGNHVDDAGRVVGFLEKPKSEDDLKLGTAPGWLESQGVASQGRDCLASMGIYLFNCNTLVKCCRRPTTATSAKRSSRPRSAPRAGLLVRRLLGGHRNHQVVLRGQSEAGYASRRSIWPPQKPPSTALDTFLLARRSATVSSSLLADGCSIAPARSSRTA